MLSLCSDCVDLCYHEIQLLLVSNIYLISKCTPVLLQVDLCDDALSSADHFAHSHLYRLQHMLMFLCK